MWDEKRRRVRQRKRKVIRPSHTIRGRDLVRALELIHDVTGDPRFDEALRAVHYYELGKELERTAARVRKETHYTDVQACLGQVHFLYTCRGLSVRGACEQVVAETGLPGTSFERAVDRLRKEYRKSALWENIGT
jgi:hypothetical protein